MGPDTTVVMGIFGIFFSLKVDYQKGKILNFFFFLIQSQASLENSGPDQLNLFLWVLVDPELIMGTSIFIRSGRPKEEKKIQMFQRNQARGRILLF